MYKEKGSKFFGYAFPINFQGDVQDSLEKVRLEHPKARHICTAFLLGQGDDQYFLTNDDGEPSNSAGAPILGQIRSANITNTYIAVVRYFGGTKLGVGGLISAYKLSAAEAIQSNQIIEVEPQASFSFKVGFDKMGSILSIIDKNQLNAKIENLANGVQIDLLFPKKDKEQIISLFDRWEVH